MEKIEAFKDIGFSVGGQKAVEQCIELVRSHAVIHGTSSRLILSIICTLAETELLASLIMIQIDLGPHSGLIGSGTQGFHRSATIAVLVAIVCQCYIFLPTHWGLLGWYHYF